MKTQYCRIVAAAVATTTLMGAAQVVDTPASVFGVQQAQAATIDNINVRDAYFVTKDGDRVSGETTGETLAAVSDFVMDFEVPAGVQPGDTAYFELEKKLENEVFDFEEGRTYKERAFVIGNLTYGSRYPIVDNDGVVVATVVPVNNGFRFKIEFEDRVSQYVGGEVRQLRLPVNIHVDSDRSIQFDGLSKDIRQEQTLNAYIFLNQLSSTFEKLSGSREVTRFSKAYGVTASPSVIRFYRGNFSDGLNSVLIMSAWADERLYATNLPGAYKGRLHTRIAPQANPEDITFSFQLPEGADVANPPINEWVVESFDYIPYSDLDPNKSGTYGYSISDKKSITRGTRSEPGLFEYSYDEATRTYTMTLEGREPGLAYSIDIFPSFTLPITSSESYRNIIYPKFISGTSSEYYIQTDVPPGHSTEFGSVKPIDSHIEFMGDVGEGNFDGEPIDINFDLDVFAEDTRSTEQDVTGVTASGNSSSATSADDAVFVEDGQANYTLRIENKSNVALTAPRVTLPNGEVVQFERPGDGSNKRWASTRSGDKGSKIPVGGVGYLTLPAEDIAWGTQPTQKDFKIEYQYANDPDNTQSATTWVQRDLPDMFVSDAFTDGRDVVITTADENGAAGETYRFKLPNLVESIAYDDVNDVIVVNNFDRIVTRFKVATTRLSAGDNGVVLEATDTKGAKQVVELANSSDVNTRLKEVANGVNADADKLAKTIGDLQTQVNAQSEVARELGNEVTRTNEIAENAKKAVVEAESHLEQLLSQADKVSKTQIEGAREDVANAKRVHAQAVNAAETAQTSLDQVMAQLKDIKGRVDEREAEYLDVVNQFAESETHLAELIVSRDELTRKLAGLRSDIRTVQRDQADNETNVQLLEDEASKLHDKLQANRKAFEDEVAHAESVRKQLSEHATRVGQETSKVSEQLNEISGSLAEIDAAIAQAQKDAEAVLAELVVGAERNPDNTVDLNRKNGEKLVIPEANKRGLEKCATGVGGAVLAGLPVVLLAATAVAQSNLPGIDAQIAQAQRKMGNFNPQLARAVRDNAGAIGATLTVTTLIGLLAAPGLCGDQSVIGALREDLNSK